MDIHNLQSLGNPSLYDWLVPLINSDVNPWEKSAGWGHFSEEPKADYMKFIAETPSFIYYSIIYDWAHITIKGNGTEALTDDAKGWYRNSTEDFGLLCGDSFISEFQEGGMLLISITPEFESPADKEDFEAQHSLTPDSGDPLWKMDMVNATLLIQETLKELSGWFTVAAYQIGGTNKNGLNEILPPMPGLNYNHIRCNFSDITLCLDKVEKLNEYAENGF